jgi:hypothetical protein
VATNGQVQVLDYMDYANLTRNHSYGSLPDGQAFDRQEFFYVTPGGTNNGLSAPLSVRINEWMAANTTTLLDPVTGKYSDWFELYNYGATAADLGGYYLTDNLTNQFQFQIPSGWTIPPHGFLLVWADGKSTNGTPDLHVTFKMNKDGESLGLYDSDGAAVDFVSYGPQTNDVSEGLYPDGSANVMFLPKPTPGTNNYANSAPVLAAIPDQFLNLGQTLLVTASATDTDQPPQSLTFTLGAGGPPGAAIDPVTGQLTWTPLTAPLTNLLSVVVTDNGSPSLSASRTFMVTVLPPPQFENITVNGNLLSLTWPSLPGETYEIEYCDDLDTGVWTTSGAPVAGDGTPLTFTADMTAAPTRFFRLRIQR